MKLTVASCRVGFQLVQLPHLPPHMATGSGSCCEVAGSPSTVLGWRVATMTAERWHGLGAAQSSRTTSLAPACFPEEGRRNPPNPLHGTCANRYCSGYLRDYRGRASECQGGMATSLPAHCRAMEGHIWRPVCSSGLGKIDAEEEMAQDLSEKQ